MLYRKAGRTDLELSVLGLGCWALGGGSYWGESDPAEEKRLLHTAFDLGINYLDTAELYYEGRSEVALGKAIEDLPRERLIIGSKLFPTHAYFQQAQEHCEASLQRIGTDYLDLYMVHWPLNRRSLQLATDNPDILSRPPRIEDAIAALLKLRDEGKIRHIGVSNFGIPWIEEFERHGITISVNQVLYNLFSRAIEFDLIPFCVQKEIGVIGYSALMEGFLSGKYHSIDKIPAHYLRTRHYHHSRSPQSRHEGEGCEKELMQALGQLRSLANELNVGMAELSLWWATRNHHVTCVLTGTRSHQRIVENAKGVALELPEEVYLALNKLSESVKDALGSNFDYYESSENDRTCLMD